MSSTVATITFPELRTLVTGLWPDAVQHLHLHPSTAPVVLDGLYLDVRGRESAATLIRARDRLLDVLESRWLLEVDHVTGGVVGWAAHEGRRLVTMGRAERPRVEWLLKVSRAQAGRVADEASSRPPLWQGLRGGR